MEWNKTIASQCRYGDVAERIWGDWNVIWEDSEADYQGHATILAEKDGKYAFYEWFYGSCSECDAWEADGRDDDAIEKEMRDSAIWLDSREELIKWMDMLNGNPRGNFDPQRMTMSAGMDMLTGGLRDRINAVRAHLGMDPLEESK